jgi:hypothetical protein
MNFPASPTLNQTYTFGGVTYVWDGTVWVRQTGSTTTALDPATLFYSSMYLRGRL